MSESLLKVGCRVNVPSKSVKGTVEYIGTTAFAPGKWVGINLDEPKGKNNGTVKEKQYFKCQENHGMFVRQTQLVVLDENDSPVLDLTEEATPKSKSTTKLSRRSSPHSVGKPETSSSRLSLASVTSSPSREDLTGSTQSLSSQTSASKRTSSFVEKTPSSKLPKQIPSASKSSKVPTTQKQTSARRSLNVSKDDVSSEQVIEPALLFLNDSVLAVGVSDFSKEQPLYENFSNRFKTGFVETLKPQFTPGQIMLSPGQPGPVGINPGSTTGVSTVGGAMNVGLLQQEIESLKEQLKDTQEKYETLKVKRVQDKEKLKEFDKIKIQLEQMLEFKSKIMESQAALQRELQLAKKEARDAIEAKNLHAEEMSDLAETVEMATLDKEMAEEKAESLQIELQEVRDKLEEVTLDYETLKAELEGGDANGEGAKGKTSFEFKQLEQQNVRLRETLVKMRDLVAHDKHEYQKLQKDLDQKKSEIAELSRTKEKLSALVETLEEQIGDLQEQVDAALGAEELVETLGNDKMTLQEKVSELQEEITDLEALKDTNDQLLEAQKEIDTELREELDMALNTIRETQREKDAALESLNDCHQTIQKFRELVAKLQEQLHDLQERLDEEAKKPVKIPEMLDFQKVFTETKAHKRAIDLELRQIELSQKDKHVQMLTAFMPDSFLNRGGDHDAILLILLIPRLLCKCDIILSQISCKFPKVENIQCSSVVKEDGVVQYACRCRLSYFLYMSQMILHQFIHGLDTCSSDTLLKCGGKYMEIIVQEKIIDSYIETLKKDQLDENVLTDPLEKFIAYFDAMRGILFENDCDKLHQSYCIKDATQAMMSACESLLTDCLSIQAVFQGLESGSEVILMIQFIAASVEQCLSQLKNIKRKVPSDEVNLNIPMPLLTRLINTCRVMSKIVKAVHEISRNSRQHILLQGEQAKGIGNDKLAELFQAAIDKNLESDELTGVDSAKKEIVNIVKIVSELNDIVDKTDYDFVSPSNAKPSERPIVIRATAVKKELDETKILAKRLENKEMDIKELKMALKAKQEELSEMCIRKELIEKKLSNINKDHESETVKLRTELEEVKKEAKKKEKEFEGAMDHLSSDIEELEKERDKLREKLKIHSKKQPCDPPLKTDSSVNKTSSSSPKHSWSSSEGNSLQDQVDQLRNALKHMSLAYFKLQSDFNRKQLNNLPSIPLLAGQAEMNKNAKKILNELWKEGQELQKQLHNNLVFKIADFSKVKPGEKVDPNEFFSKEFNRKKEIRDKINNFAHRVNDQIVKLTRGGHIETTLAVFPTPELKKALSETQPLTIGELRVPAELKESKNVPVVVNLNSLKAIQDKLTLLMT